MKDFINANKILQYMDKKVFLELSTYISDKKDNEKTSNMLAEIYDNIPSKGKYILNNDMIVSAPIMVQKYIEQYIKDENIISYRDFLINNIKLNTGRFYYDDQIIVKENLYDRILQNEDFIDDVVERKDGSKETVRDIVENEVFDLIPEDGKCTLDDNNNKMNAYQFIKKLYQSGKLALSKEELKDELIKFKGDDSIIEIDMDLLNTGKRTSNLIYLDFEDKKKMAKQEIEETKQENLELKAEQKEENKTLNKEEIKEEQELKPNIDNEINKEEIKAKEENKVEEVKEVNKVNEEKDRDTYIDKLDLSEALEEKLSKLSEEEKEKLSQALYDVAKGVLSDIKTNKVLSGKEVISSYKNDNKKEETLNKTFNEVFEIEKNVKDSEVEDKKEEIKQEENKEEKENKDIKEEINKVEEVKDIWDNFSEEAIVEENKEDKEVETKEENKEEVEKEENKEVKEEVKETKKIDIKKGMNSLVEKSGIQINDIYNFKNKACKCLDTDKTQDKEKLDDEKDR